MGILLWDILLKRVAELALRGISGRGAPAALELRVMAESFVWGMECDEVRIVAIIEDMRVASYGRSQP